MHGLGHFKCWDTQTVRLGVFLEWSFLKQLKIFKFRNRAPGVSHALRAASPRCRAGGGGSPSPGRRPPFDHHRPPSDTRALKNYGSFALSNSRGNSLIKSMPILIILALMRQSPPYFPGPHHSGSSWPARSRKPREAIARASCSSWVTSRVDTPATAMCWRNS